MTTTVVSGVSSWEANVDIYRDSDQSRAGRSEQGRSLGLLAGAGVGVGIFRTVPSVDGKKPKMHYSSCSSKGRAPCCSIPKLDLKAGFRPLRQHPDALLVKKSKSHGPKLHLVAGEGAFPILYSCLSPFKARGIWVS